MLSYLTTTADSVPLLIDLIPKIVLPSEREVRVYPTSVLLLDPNLKISQEEVSLFERKITKSMLSSFTELAQPVHKTCELVEIH